MLRPGTLSLTTLLAMLTALGPLSMDMYLPSLPDIARVLEAPTARVQLTISSYLIGFAVGQLIYGPLSDRHGRRPVLFAALGKDPRQEMVYFSRDLLMDCSSRFFSCSVQPPRCVSTGRSRQIFSLRVMRF